MNVLWEAMVSEMRAERLELDNRRHFTKDGDAIRLVRQDLAEWTEIKQAEDPELVAVKTATNLRQAADDDLFEMG